MNMFEYHSIVTNFARPFWFGVFGGIGDIRD